MTTTDDPGTDPVHAEAPVRPAGTLPDPRGRHAAPAAGGIAPRRQSQAIVQMPLSDMLEGMTSGALVPSAPEEPLMTGFDPLDKALEGGFRRGDLSIIGGLPGVGKTVATLQWAQRFAQRGERVLYHCYEHDVPTLFARLLASECGALAMHVTPEDAEEIKAAVQAMSHGDWDPVREYAVQPIVRAALAQIASYADRLILSQLASTTADIDMIQASITEADEPYDAVFVDYLQKVPVPGLHGLDKYAETVEGLKNIALSEHCHIMAVSAVGEGALSDQRLHIEGLRGAHVLAHEADVVMTLNRKLRVVAKAHLSFDSTLHARYANTVVFSIEKNRRGMAPLNLEFDSDFGHFRFDPHGRFVAEKLVDGLLIEE